MPTGSTHQRTRDEPRERPSATPRRVAKAPAPMEVPAKICCAVLPVGMCRVDAPAVERKYCARAITNSCAGTSFGAGRSAWLLAIRAGNAGVKRASSPRRWRFCRSSAGACERQNARVCGFQICASQIHGSPPSNGPAIPVFALLSLRPLSPHAAPRHLCGSMVLRALTSQAPYPSAPFPWRRRVRRRVGRDGRPSRVGKRCDPLGAFVDPTPSSDARQAGGKPGGEPLEGMKFVVKDIFDIEGRVRLALPRGWRRTIARRSPLAVSQCADAGAAGVGDAHGRVRHASTARTRTGGSVIRARGRIPGVPPAVRRRRRPCPRGGLRVGHRQRRQRRSPRLTGCYGSPTPARFPPRVSPFAPSMDTVGWFARDPAVLRKVGRVPSAGKSRRWASLPSRFSW